MHMDIGKIYAADFHYLKNTKHGGLRAAKLIKEASFEEFLP